MELALAYPYSLGLVAAFNPCGFALLPAYLSYFISVEPSEHGGASGQEGSSGNMMLVAVLRAIIVGVTLTAGFVAVFGVFGVMFETFLSQKAVFDRIGYVTVVVGIAMALLGVWLLAGRSINLRLPKISKGTEGRGLPSVFMFGVSYAVVSLSCTIGLFIGAVTTSFTNQGFADGVANFVAYALGMGSVIIFLTLALAMARTNVVRAMRKALRWINPVSGLLLVVSGVYVANYGWWELQLLKDVTASNALVDWFYKLQGEISNWISQTTPHRLGVLCALGVLGTLLLGWCKAESDALKRWAVIAAYAVLYGVVEFFNRGEFIALPVWRFVAGWPLRVAHWFTDPLRFGVLGEILFTALVVWIAWRWLRHLQQRLHPQPKPAAPPPPPTPTARAAASNDRPNQPKPAAHVES